MESIVSEFQKRQFCFVGKLVNSFEEFVFDLRISAFGNGHADDLYILVCILNGGAKCAQRTEHTVFGTSKYLLHIVVNVFEIELVPVLGIVDLHNAAHDIELHCKIKRLLCLQNSCTLLGRLTGFFGSNLIFQLGGIKLNVRYCSNFGMLKVGQGSSTLGFTEHDGREIGCSVFNKCKFRNQLRAFVVVQEFQYIVNALTNFGKLRADVGKKILTSCKRCYGKDVHEADHLCARLNKRSSANNTAISTDHNSAQATLFQAHENALYAFWEAEYIGFRQSIGSSNCRRKLEQRIEPYTSLFRKRKLLELGSILKVVGDFTR